MSDHWLVRPSTIRRLWAGFIAVLALTIAAELFVAHDAHFSVERVFGFGAWYGFIACAVLIVFAKGIAVFLERPDSYYDEDGAGD